MNINLAVTDPAEDDTILGMIQEHQDLVVRMGGHSVIDMPVLIPDPEFGAAGSYQVWNQVWLRTGMVSRYCWVWVDPEGVPHYRHTPTAESELTL